MFSTKTDPQSKDRGSVTLLFGLCLFQECIHLGAANRAGALCNSATFIVNHNGAREGLLLFAFHAIGLTCVCI